MLPPVLTVEKCKYCRKEKVIRRGNASEWVCPSCGKTNRKERLSAWLL